MNFLFVITVLIINQKLNAQDYMEDEYIIGFPESEGQNFQLGDLWDCSNSAGVDFNLFSNSISPETDLKRNTHFNVVPISQGNSGYPDLGNINHRLSTFKADNLIKLEALAGLIDVYGLSDYFDNNRKSGFIKATNFYYHLNLFQIRLNLNARKLINENVSNHLLNNQIKATHYVHAIDTGAFFDASITTVDRENMKTVIYVNSKP
jgi:hypothetical protein